MARAKPRVATITHIAEARPYEHWSRLQSLTCEFEARLSRNTLEAYRSDLFQFGRFLEDRDRGAADARAPTSPTS